MLAFPFNGNTWQHYKVLWVDLTRKTIEVTRSHTSNGYVCDYASLMFHFHNEDGITKGLERRIAGKINRVHKFYDDQDWIVNGVSQPTRFFSHSRERFEEKYAKYPIRFKPVKITYSTREVVFGDLSNEHMYEEICWDLELMFRDHCDGSRFCFDRNDSYQIKPGHHFKAVKNTLEKAFLNMSHSQVVNVARETWQTDLKPKSLRDLFVVGPFHREMDALRLLLDRAFPRKSKFTTNDKKSLIIRCANRFIRRHPTRATSNLLKMMAAFSKLTRKTINRKLSPPCNT